MRPNAPGYGWEWYWWWGDVDVRIQTRRVTLRGYWEAVYKQLDGNAFDWRICSVASLGFLASSYSLFATSIIWPALVAVYPHADDKKQFKPGEAIDQVTLGGIISGMLLFGFLSDRVGRKTLYGLELIIITFATIGIVFSSEGYRKPRDEDVALAYNSTEYDSTMDVFDSVLVWRSVLGVGIGAEYPMSSIIAAEYVSTDSRGTNMAIVFLMQSVGRLFAFLFTLAFLYGQDPGGNNQSAGFNMNFIIDKTWRFGAGLGGLFAVSAILLRLTIPESPRFHPKMTAIIMEAVEPRPTTPSSATGDDADDFRKPPSPPWFLAAKRYLVDKKKWRPLAIMCLLWFLLDVCFFGMAFDSPSTLNLFFLEDSADSSETLGQYEVDPDDVRKPIYGILYRNAWRALVVSSISSLLGAFASIWLINHRSRKSLLIWTSSALFVILVITGAAFMTEYAKKGDTLALVFYSLAQFFFNLGPNTVIFIMAAEIWPSAFRGTFYGLSAASGKIAAMVIRFGVQGTTDIATNGKNPNPHPMGIIIIFYGFIMLGIALIAWFDTTLPEVQVPRPAGLRNIFLRVKNKHLEVIAPEFDPGYLALDK